MTPTGGFTYELSPDGCQTEIDAVAWERYSLREQPSYLSAKDGFFFKQTTTNLMGYTWDEDENVGEFDEMGEQVEFADTDTRLGNTTNVRQTKWGKQVPVSLEAFKADLHGKRANIGKQIGNRARLTQDRR